MVKDKVSRGCLAFCLFNCPPTPTPMAEALQKMNLVEMRTPREVWPVGTILALKRDQWNNIVQVSDVCDPRRSAPERAVLGVGFFEERTGELSELERSSRSGKIGVTGVILSDLKASLSAEGQYISSATLSISNTKLQYADAVALTQTARRMMQDPECLQQVKIYSQQPLELTSLSHVLVADLSYTISFTSGVDAALKADLLKRLGGTLGAGYDVEQGRVFRGRSLTFGFGLPPVSPLPTP